MTEPEVITAPAEETQVQDIQIVEFSRGDAATDNRPYMQAVNDDFKNPGAEETIVKAVETAVEVKDVVPVVVPIEEKAITPPPAIDVVPDVYATLTEKHGRAIDEDYLTVDYRDKAKVAEELLTTTKEKLDSFKHIFENKDLLQIADLMKKGSTAKDILEAMSIEPDNIPSDQLILDYIKRDKPFLSKEDIALFAEQNYGLGEDLAVLKTEDPERYFKLQEHIHKAMSDQKQYLSEKKVSLLNVPATVQPAAQDNLITVEKVKNYKSSFNNHVDSLTEIKVSDEFSSPYDKTQLQSVSDNIVFSGDLGDNKNVVMLSGVDDKTVLEALYFYKQKDALISEFKTKLEKSITEQKSVEAFKKVDEIYNNVAGAGQQAGGEGGVLEIVEAKRNTSNASGW